MLVFFGTTSHNTIQAQTLLKKIKKEITKKEQKKQNSSAKKSHENNLQLLLPQTKTKNILNTEEDEDRVITEI